MTVRPSRAADAAQLARIYREAIRCAGRHHYSPLQVAAWSALGDELPAFRVWLAGACTWVAQDAAGRRSGFAGIERPLRIASLFVAPHAARRGVGTALVEFLLGELARSAVTGVCTEASACSLPVFERCGFRVVAREHTRVRGVAFTRHAMRLELPAP